MLKKTISKTGLNVSELGLGCMGMSEFYGPIDDEEAILTLERAVELGITHFDTADIYGMGKNEVLVGKHLKKYRDQLIIASKFGIIRDLSDPTRRGISGKPEYVKLCCEASLRRLGMDTIDLYYAHRVDPTVPIEETMGALSDLAKQGKIRFIGLSEATPEVIRKAHRVHPLTAIQSEFSLWSRGPEKEVIPLCKELGIGFVAYSPMGRGFLTGKLRKTEQLASNDYRRFSPRFQEENLTENLKLVEKLEAMAKEHNCTPAQLCLAWVLAQGNHVTAIPGTKRRKYLEENCGAVQLKLTADNLEQLDREFPKGIAKGDRYPVAQMVNPDK